MRHPFMGEPVGFQEWIHTGWRDLLPGRNNEFLLM